MGPMWRAWVNIGQVDFIVNKFSDILLVHISQLYSVATEPLYIRKQEWSCFRINQFRQNHINPGRI